MDSRHRGEEFLLLRWKTTHDEAARDELLQLYLPLVKRLARRYSYTSEPLDDLFQVGSIALLKAVDRYEPGKGASFKAYVVPTVVGELRRHFRDTGWAVHMPRSLQERARAVGVAIGTLTGQLGRSPTIAETAQWMGIGREEVIEAMDVRLAYEPASLDAPRREGEADGALYRLGAEDERLEYVEYTAGLERTLRAMTERERLVLHLRFDEDLSQSEIARRVGCSQMHVSRLLRRALARLRAVGTGHGP